MFSLFDDSELVVAKMGIVGVSVDIGFVGARFKEIEIDVDATASFIGNATNVPVIGIAVFSGDDVIFTNFAGERDGFGEISRDVVDEIELFGKSIFIDERAVGGHLHGGIDGDEIGELASKSGAHAFDVVGQV